VYSGQDAVVPRITTGASARPSASARAAGPSLLASRVGMLHSGGDSTPHRPHARGQRSWMSASAVPDGGGAQISAKGMEQKPSSDRRVQLINGSGQPSTVHGHGPWSLQSRSSAPVVAATNSACIAAKKMFDFRGLFSFTDGLFC